MPSRVRVLAMALVVGLVGAGSAQAAMTSVNFQPPAFAKGTAGPPPFVSVPVAWGPGALPNGTFDPPSANDKHDLSAADITGGPTITAEVGGTTTSVPLGLSNGHLYTITISTCQTPGPCVIGSINTISTPGVTRVDATPPTGTVQIDGGAAATNKREVTLNLSATDPLIGGIAGSASGVDQYAVDVDNDGTFPCTFFVLPGVTPDTSGCAGNFAPTAQTTLTANDGVKTVGVKFGDAARTISAPCRPPFCFILLSGEMLGNEGPVATDSIILDTLKPVAIATQDRFTVERGQTVSFDSATSLDPSPTTPSGVDPGAASWDFKDGTPTATGQKVTHTFNQAGTFVGELRVKDRAGNQSDARQFSVTVTARPGETASGGGSVGAVSGGTADFSIARVKLNAKYQKSKLKGSLTLTGNTSQAGSLRVELRAGAKVRRLSTVLAAGAFEKTLKLPADLLPGTYRLTFAGPSGTLTSSLKLIAPREGVLRSGKLTASRRAARATFTLANQPVKALRGRLTVSWRLGGKSLGLVKVRSATKIGAPLPAGATLAKGRLTAQLRAGAVVVGDAVVRVR